MTTTSARGHLPHLHRLRHLRDDVARTTVAVNAAEPQLPAQLPARFPGNALSPPLLTYGAWGRIGELVQISQATFVTRRYIQLSCIVKLEAELRSEHWVLVSAVSTVRLCCGHLRQKRFTCAGGGRRRRFSTGFRGRRPVPCMLQAESSPMSGDN